MRFSWLVLLLAGRLALTTEGCGVDADGDGVVACTSATTEGCDCDDTNPDIHPGAVEVPYDGIDQDCDYEDLVDVDGDGYDADVVGGTDCDDDNEFVHPEAEELCNVTDDDCDGQVDEDLPTQTYFLDEDSDYYGDNATATTTCFHLDQDEDGSWTTTGGDCNDADSAVHPDAAEYCDGTDSDCDGISDSGFVTVFHVDGSEPYNFLTIQEGVDAASTGDTVKVCAGNYAGFVISGKNTLSVVGIGSVVIDKPATTVTDPWGGSHTSGLVIYDSTNLYIRGLTITGISSMEGLGGGVAIWSSTPTVACNIGLWDMTITANSAAKGGGMWIRDCSNVTTNRLEITNNDAVAGGGGGVFFNGNAGTGSVSEAYIAFVDTVFDGNWASEKGYQVYQRGAKSSVTLKNCWLGADVSKQAYELYNDSSMSYGVLTVTSSTWEAIPSGSSSRHLQMYTGQQYTFMADTPVSGVCRQDGTCSVQ